jgi:hypothetical protein
MKFAEGKIEAFVGPTELGASDDLEQVMTGFIGEAEESLDIAVQESTASRSPRRSSMRAGEA